MKNEWWIGKDLEGSAHVLIEPTCPEKLMKTMRNFMWASDYFEVWTQHLFNTRLGHYCCISLFHISLAWEDILCLLRVLYTLRHYRHAGSSRDCIWSQTCAWLQLIENTYISIGPSISILHTRIYHTWRGGTYNRTCQFISKTKMDTAVTSPVAELGRNSTSKGNDSRKVTWGNALVCSCILLKCAI